MKNIRKKEMFVILFNLLDNAIEASELQEKEKRDIEVELYCCESVIEIFIRNNITCSVLLHNPQFWSNKEQEGHGIGHLSVEASVDELEGIIEYYEEKGSFVHTYLYRFILLRIKRIVEEGNRLKCLFFCRKLEEFI